MTDDPGKKPPDPKGGEPDPSKAPDPGKDFDPVKTAYSLARQPDSVIQETIDILALRKPDLFKMEEPAPPEKKDEGGDKGDPKPDLNSEVMNKIHNLERQNWVKDAILDNELGKDDAAFLTGTTQAGINAQAKLLKDRIGKSKSDDGKDDPKDGKDIKNQDNNRIADDTGKDYGKGKSDPTKEAFAEAVAKGETGIPAFDAALKP